MENYGQFCVIEVKKWIFLLFKCNVIYNLIVQDGLMTILHDSTLAVWSVLLTISIRVASFTEISNQKIFY